MLKVDYINNFETKAFDALRSEKASDRRIEVAHNAAD
jgi:hypothetical protein